MIPFDAKKTTHAAAEILQCQPNRRTNYMRLLKLLYIANRRCLKEKGRLLCGDRIYAMNRGPVMSATLDLIKDKDSPEWSSHITRDRYEVELTAQPQSPSLSRYEIRVLHEVCEEFADYDEWALVEWCHDHLPEFKKHDPATKGPGVSREPIPLEDIFEAVGRGAEMKEMLAEANAALAFSRLFRDHELC